jgi:hypothetical protein
MSRSARAAHFAGTICVALEVGEIEVDGQGIWFYVAMNCQQPYGTYSYYNSQRLDPAQLGCGGRYCLPASTCTDPSGIEWDPEILPTSPTLSLKLIDKKLKKEGLARPLPADRTFQASDPERVWVLEQGNYRVPGLKHPVYLALVLVMLPDDEEGRPQPLLLQGLGVTTNAAQAPVVPLRVIRPDARDQYFLLHRRRDDVVFHVVTANE